MSSISRNSRIVLLLLSATLASAAERWAPHAEAGPVDQLSVAGNACGPAAVLTSIRCGSPRWRGIVEQIPGQSDRSKLLYLIRAYGLQPSASLKSQRRWSRQGINLEDLTAIVGELAAVGRIPPPQSLALGHRRELRAERQLRQTHRAIDGSLEAGFPPVLNLRRLVRRDGQWQDLEGHFVSIMMVPDSLDRRSTSFAVHYFDPWGGRRSQGRIRLPTKSEMSAATELGSFLIADFPAVRCGRSKVRSGEPTLVLATALIRR